ncbi:MAG: hypothetical protein NT154_13905 [Verrucomicrobia bacterium]|nr:hypothetical protein [Verrucomicrobiota bacterium]
MKASLHKSLLVSSGTMLLALTAALPTRADYASTVAGLGPVAYYRLSTTNLVPAELSATNIGSLGTAFNGQYQQMSLSRGLPGAIVGDSSTSVATDGANKRVVVPYSAAYNPPGAFTVEAWLNPGSDGSALSAPLNAAEMVGNRSGWLLYQNGTSGWSFRMYNQNSTSFSLELAGGGTVETNTWYHIVATYDGTTATLYVNGTEAANGQPSGSPSAYVANTDGPFVIGARSDFAYAWNGRADEVAIYTTALSVSDVQAHYTNGINSARSQQYSALVQSKSPALYYRLDEPSLQLPVATNSGSYGLTYNGAYQSGTTPGLPGPQMPAVTGFETTNRAAGFNGLNGSVTIPGLPLNSDTVTMVCWLKRNGTQPARAGIMHNRKVTATVVLATGLGFLDDGLHLSYNWEDQGTAYNYNPGFVPPDQAWTFYAVTIAPDAQVMYMGTAAGLVAGTNTFAISPHDFSGTTLELGWDNYATTRIFNGQIDEFAMFDKTLSYAEVSSLFNAAMPAILSLTRTPTDPVYEGMTVTLQTSVAGPAPITYQWRVGGIPLTGKTNASLVLNGVTTTNSGDYDVQVTTGGKTLASAVNHLAVLTSAPILTQVPASAVRFINARATFVSAAIGSQPLTYQWKHDGVAIPGATSPSLALTDLQPADAGQYTVVASNPLGTTQAVANLTLMTPYKYSAAVVDASPVGYWRLDETNGTTAYDYWGGADGTASASGVTNNQPGPRPAASAGFESTNRAYYFGGNAATVQVSPLNLNKATVTMVAWIKPHGTQVAYAGIVFSRGGTACGLDYNNATGDLGYHWNDAANTHGWDSGLPPVADQWNFVALVIEPTQATIYLDDGSGTGLQSAVNSVTHGAASFADPLRFCRSLTNGRRTARICPAPSAPACRSPMRLKPTRARTSWWFRKAPPR